MRKDENETLAALFADRDGGQDTFGNIGSLRYVFVVPAVRLFSPESDKSFRYGYTDAGKQVQQQTLKSHNPFAPQSQSTNERPFFDI